MTKYVEIYFTFSKHDNKYLIIIIVQSLLLSSSYFVGSTKKSSLISDSLNSFLSSLGMKGKGKFVPILYMSLGLFSKDKIIFLFNFFFNIGIFNTFKFFENAYKIRLLIDHFYNTHIPQSLNLSVSLI